MMEREGAAVGLTPKDMAFLQHSRKSVKAYVVSGWLLIGCSLFSGIMVAANFDRIVSISGLQAIQTSATRKLQTEQDRLQNLQTATPLEEQLVKALIEMTERMKALLKVQLILTIWLPIGLVSGGFLTEGVRLIVHAVGLRRYLRIIEVLERSLRLSRG